MRKTILRMVAFILITFITILVVIFLALRIPQLSVQKHVTTSEKLQILDKWLELIYRKGKFNGVVLLSKNGKVIFSKSYGNNGLEPPTRLTEHSSFNLASVSKQFTAIGVMILNHQSKITYKNKLSEYIPELSNYKNITIQHLLQHTSGLPDYMRVIPKYQNNDDIFTASKMISIYQNYQPALRFKPGSKFEYSNTGYVLLAEIISRVSGMSFSQFMSKHIFQPLNMNDTQVFNLLSKNEPENRVYGFNRKYWLFGDKKQNQDLNYFDGVAGDGGVYSSAHDLNKWHTSLNKGTLIPLKSYEIAYSPALLNNNTKTQYGFGWFINKDGSVEHSGGWQGFTSYIFRDLKNSDLIVILDNSANTYRVGSIGYRFNSIALNLEHFMSSL